MAIISEIPNMANIIIISCSQSNGEGNGNITELSSYLQGWQYGKNIFYKTNSASSNTGNFFPLNAGNNSQNPDDGFVTKCGTEISMIYKIKNTYKKDIFIVKYCVGSTTIGNNSPPSWKITANNLYTNLKNNYITDAINKIKGFAKNYRIAAHIISLGESDSELDVGYSDSYETNMINYINDFRSNYGLSIPFLFHRITDLSAWAPGIYWQRIRTAQTNISINIPNCYLINCDGLIKQADNVHYSTGALEIIGNLTADKLIEINAII